MKRSQLIYLCWIGAMIEMALFSMACLGLIGHPVFSVLLGTWGFVAGVAVTKYKEKYHG